MESLQIIYTHDINIFKEPSVKFGVAGTRFHAVSVTHSTPVRAGVWNPHLTYIHGILRRGANLIHLHVQRCLQEHAAEREQRVIAI